MWEPMETNPTHGALGALRPRASHVFPRKCQLEECCGLKRGAVLHGLVFSVLCLQTVEWAEQGGATPGALNLCCLSQRERCGFKRVAVLLWLRVLCSLRAGERLGQSRVARAPGAPYLCCLSQGVLAFLLWLCVFCSLRQVCVVFLKLFCGT